ncbi:MAG TPA: hypothetical protein PLW44_12985 [Chitinophagales bacterium]|nr:hypothetical protein [Chitinophagales bacterium]
MSSRLVMSIVCVLLFCACNEKRTQKKKYNQDSSEVQSITNVPDNSVALPAEPPRPANPIVDYNFIPNPSYTPWSGTRTAQAKWADLAGNHVVILSILHQYYWSEKKPEFKKLMKNEEETEATEFFATHYLLPKDSVEWKKYWEYNNVRLSCCDVSHTYLPGTLQITDIDSNGVLETVFGYHTTEGNEAIDFNYPGKLVFYTDTTPYIINGPIGLMRNHYQTAHLQFSPSCNKLGNLYKEYLAREWEQIINLRDSLDNNLKKLWE